MGDGFKQLMLNSTQIEDVVEVRVELCKKFEGKKLSLLANQFFPVQLKGWC